MVSAVELRDLGASGDVVTRWLGQGRLYRLHRGVYAVGHLALTLRSRELAAVLACGPGALRSHRSAGAAHDLRRHTSPIEVNAPRSRESHSGFVLHRSRCLEPEDATSVDGIATTSVARTLVDLADVLTEKRLADAVHEAEVRRVFDLTAIESTLGRLPGRRGRHRLRRVLAQYGGGPQRTRSEGERRFLELVAVHRLPTPLSSVQRAGYELDFLWPDAGLGVEFDGEAFHHTVRAYHSDRRRDRKLAVVDIQVIRITWHDLTAGQETLVRDLRDLLHDSALPRC
ncbi:DUF559 domain-containing protein [soil metagenome]